MLKLRYLTSMIIGGFFKIFLSFWLIFKGFNYTHSHDRVDMNVERSHLSATT
ncbi:MAG: hypothetical protein ACI8VW_003658 [bacterium]|jgi:hypothetical protein